MKPYSESCVQNREPILSVIEPLFRDRKDVLEIGSGTGQHAVYFAAKMPHLTWHTSDLAENDDGIRAWLNEAALPNTTGPVSLDVLDRPWSAPEADAVFSANTTHIMHWDSVVALFGGVGELLRKRGLFCLYGPFNYGGEYTSESNAQFDEWLHERDPLSGIRDFDDLDRLALQAGLRLEHDYAMPANNRILSWRKA